MAEPNLLSEDEDLPLDRLGEYPLLVKAYAWWARHRPAPRPPSLELLRISSRLQPRLVLMDVEGPGKFRTRVAGQYVCRDRGHELDGTLLEDIHRADELERVAAPLRRVVDTWRPDLRVRRYLTAALVDHRYARLALPLSADGLRVTALLLISEALR